MALTPTATPSDGEIPGGIPQTTSAPELTPLHAIGNSETGAEAQAKVRALKRKKLAIVGFAPGTYGQAPFHDASWDIWALNEAYTLPGFSRADRWFEMHIRQEVDISTRDPNHINWLKSRRDLPIYMIRRFEDIPMSVSYPLKEVVHHFAMRGNGADYLTNTISYQLALAVYEKETGLQDWEYIGVWGVDMAQGGTYGQPSEYAEQRPSCEFWLGRAQGSGIFIYVPPAADLLKAPGLYGYEGDGSQMRMKIRGRVVELQGRIGGVQGQLGMLERNKMGMVGEMALAERIPWQLGMEGAQAAVKERHAALTAQVQQADGQIGQLQRQMHQLEGAVDDCLYWMRKYVLPTFTVERLTELDAKPNPILSDEVLAPKPEPLAVAAPTPDPTPVATA